jgi:RNA polymerase sigma-70 factor (ECF subfamily)
MSPNHHPSEALIAACAAGTLRPGAALLVHAHMIGCPVCPTEARFFESVGGALLEAEPAAELTPGLLQRTLSAIHLRSSAKEPPAAEAEADELMLAVARKRDEDAFIALSRTFAPRLKTYLMRRGAAPALAEDLVAEALVRVWRKTEGLDLSRATASTWIFRIARSLRRDQRLQGYLPELDEGAQPPGPADGARLARLRDERVRRALSGAPADEVEALRLSFLEDRRAEDIGERMGLSADAAKARVRRAVRRLRAAVEAEA